MNNKHKLIPVNIIAGPLGVGKTTMINHFLEHRPQGERWAILVNEYGLVGIDAALMQDSSKDSSVKEVEINEVAGGCICCSAGVFFEASLIRLLRRRPDRLLIEPTGLAALSGILNTLGREGIKEAIELRSIICSLDANRLREDLAREEVIDQIEAADILVASRADLSSPKELESFLTWGKQLFPPKKWVGSIQRGQVPLNYLDLHSNLDKEIEQVGHKHGTDHHHAAHHFVKEPTPNSTQTIISRVHLSPQTSTLGWICLKDLMFDAKKVSDWLKGFNRLAKTLRVKAVLKTNEGWWQFNYTDQVEEQWPSAYRRDSRLEVIYEGDVQLNVDNLEQQLRECLVV